MAFRPIRRPAVRPLRGLTLLAALALALAACGGGDDPDRAGGSSTTGGETEPTEGDGQTEDGGETDSTEGEDGADDPDAAEGADNETDTEQTEEGSPERKGAVLAAITALKQICNHPVNYQADDEGLDGRSGKLARLNEIMESVFAADEKMLIFTHFATWGERLAGYLAERYDMPIQCYHGGLARGARDRMVDEFQERPGAGALVLSLKAGGTGLNLTAANHVVLYDRWWNPAVEDQARDRVWRIGQTKTVIAHRLVCPGTVDERVEEVVAGKRQIANMVLPKSSSIADLDAGQLQQALGIDPELLLTREETELAGAAT